MKTNQDGGSDSAKKPSAPAEQIAGNQKGAAKYGHHKGAADYSVKNGSHDHPHGAPKMGYKQSFGAGKANCYAKGAAKVAEIMTFGASKYGHHKGAADSGHGGPAGHTHPSMTTKSIETSGGGSSSSSSSTKGGSSSSRQSTNNLSSYQATLKDLGPNFKPTAEQTAKANARVALLKKKDSEARKANSTSSSSSSNNTNSGSTTRKSETITSKKSMGAVQEKGKIADENRASKNAYNREMTNIRAASDSISARNNFLNKKPAHLQNHPKALSTAAAIGGVEAKKTRIKSGDFSFTEANKIQKAGRNSSGR